MVPFCFSVLYTMLKPLSGPENRPRDFSFSFSERDENDAPESSLIRSRSLSTDEYSPLFLRALERAASSAVNSERTSLTGQPSKFK